MHGESDVTGSGSPRAGDRVGAYELLCPIGRGGFAVVWLARLRGKHGFEKLVAIKTVRPELAADAAFDKMFIAEARITAAIEHPNVARVMDFGEEGDTLYLVMEYVPGDSLSALRRAVTKRNELFPINIAVAIVAETCAGLHAAHELSVDGRPLGIVHRDVSPQNVLISDAGIAKLVDFGIAKASDGLSVETLNGVPKGKPRYMAPEQVIPGTALDRRVDVWALGAVMYELLEGRPAVDGPNDMARIHALVSGQPIAPFSRDVPAEIADVVFQALSHDREARFPTALELGEALLDALATTGPRVSHGDVAAYCAEMLPGRRAERETMARRALAAATSQEALRPSPESGSDARDLSPAGGGTSPGLVVPRARTGERLPAPWDVAPGDGPHRTSPPLGRRVATWGPLGVAAALFVAALTIAARKPRMEAAGVAPVEATAPAPLASAREAPPLPPEVTTDVADLAAASALKPASPRPAAHAPASSARAAATGAASTVRAARVTRSGAPVSTPSSPKRVDDEIQ